MSLLKEIQKQPLHVRQLLFGLSMLVVILVVGFVWLSSFQREVYALLNPSAEDQQQFAAQAQEALPLRATISTMFNTLRASVYNLFNFNDTEQPQESAPRSQDTGVRTLPTAGIRSTPRPSPGI
ncbi:MAG: hypothetical protein AAB864_01335 [Patescibacteria group bacterium]